MVNVNINLTELPICKCGKGRLLPFYDVFQAEQLIYLKGWVCNYCGFNLFFSGGQLTTKPSPNQAP